MTKSEFLTLRANLLGGMNDYIRNVIGDDIITEYWNIHGVEDGSDEDILLEYAEDDETFTRICYVFGNIVTGFSN